MCKTYFLFSSPGLTGIGHLFFQISIDTLIKLHQGTIAVEYRVMKGHQVKGLSILIRLLLQPLQGVLYFSLAHLVGKSLAWPSYVPVDLSLTG